MPCLPLALSTIPSTAPSFLEGKERHWENWEWANPTFQQGTVTQSITPGGEGDAGLAAAPDTPSVPAASPPFPFPLSPCLFIWPSKAPAAATGSGNPKLPLGKKFWHPAAKSGDSGKLLRACLISGLDISPLSISLPKEI